MDSIFVRRSSNSDCFSSNLFMVFMSEESAACTASSVVAEGSSTLLSGGIAASLCFLLAWPLFSAEDSRVSTQSALMSVLLVLIFDCLLLGIGGGGGLVSVDSSRCSCTKLEVLFAKERLLCNCLAAVLLGNTDGGALTVGGCLFDAGSTVGFLGRSGFFFVGVSCVGVGVKLKSNTLILNCLIVKLIRLAFQYHHACRSDRCSCVLTGSTVVPVSPFFHTMTS